MTATYASMFVFGLLLLASWAGWGAALERLVVGRTTADRALHAGWGMAFAVVLGGALNLAALISPTGIHLFLVAGLALLACDGWRRRASTGAEVRGLLAGLRSRPGLALAGLVVGAMLLAAYAASVCSRDYNAHDDLQAYFVLPVKMIQTGSMGADPFSEGRLLSLGGMSFLQAIVLSVADPRYFRLVEPGVALPLAVGLLLGVARDRRASPWAALLAAFLFLSVPAPAKNAASLVTGLALFLTLLRTLFRGDLDENPGTRNAVLVALVAAALCALKTTHVPACALTVVIAGLLRWRNGRPAVAVVGNLALTGGLTLAFMAPWMIASWESNGTLLYPIFGRGFHGSAYSTDWVPYDSPSLAAIGERLWSEVTRPGVLALGVLVGGLLARRRRHGAAGSVLALALGAAAAFLALAGTHPGAYRYNWAALWAATLVLVIVSWPRAGDTPSTRVARSRVLGAVPLAVALALLVLAHGADATGYWKGRRVAIEVAVLQARTPGFKRGAERKGVKILEAVPEGATLLARLRYPFVLDFRHHTILIANYPGGSSPPPGMPFFQGGEPLARYLCDQSVRYVAYSYRTQANFSRRKFAYRLDPSEFPWTRTQARHAFDFQDNLTELGETRRRIFDNGDVFVLDLGVSATGEELPCIPG